MRGKLITDAGLEVEVDYIDRPFGDQCDDNVMDQNPRVGDAGDEGDTVTINVGASADAPPQTNPPQTNPPQTNPPQTNPPRPTHRRPTRRPPTPADHRRADHDAAATTTAGDHHETRPRPRLWGKQTELAIGNFPIANRPLDVRVAHALATIKRHAAVVNLRLGVRRGRR